MRQKVIKSLKFLGSIIFIILVIAIIIGRIYSDVAQYERCIDSNLELGKTFARSVVACSDEE